MLSLTEVAEVYPQTEFPELYPLLAFTEEEDRPPEPGDGINQAQCRYTLFRSPEAYADFCAELERYTRAIVLTVYPRSWHLGPGNGARTKVLVNCSLRKTLRNLDKFQFRGKFSTWVGTTAKRTIFDETRRQQADDRLAAKIAAKELDEKTNSCRYNGQPLETQETVHKQEIQFNVEIDFEHGLRRLKPSDRQIAKWFFCEGYTVLEIAEKLHRDLRRGERKCSPGERFVQNRLAVIKQAMQAGRFPRARVTSKADIERAYLDHDERYVSRIELEHTLSQEFRANCIVPFRPCLSDIGSEGYQGRAFTGLAKERRTKGGFTRKRLPREKRRHGKEV